MPAEPTPVELVQMRFLDEAPRIRAFVAGLVPQPAMADDVFQEVFLTVSRKADDFQPGTDFAAWVRTIARYKVLEALRDRRRSPLALSGAVLERLADEAPSEPDEDRAVSALRDCLAGIRATARDILALRYLEGLSPPAIADRVGTSVGTVHVALTRARAVLRDCLRRRLAEGGGR